MVIEFRPGQRLESKQVARLGGGRDLSTELLDDAHGLGDQRSVAGLRFGLA